MPVRAKRSAVRDRGASLVEFALILPVFVILLFGMITAGFALNDKQQITHAVREGARYAATVPASQTFASGTWAANVRALVVDRSAGTLTEGDVCVSLVEGAVATVVTPTSDFSTAPGGAACIPGQTFPLTGSDTGRRVQVSASVPAEINTLITTFAVTLKSDATTRSESNT